MNRITLLLLILVNNLSCRTAQDVVPPGAGLIGSWQYIERGYSPGAGYIIDQIPRKPVQQIDFLDAKRVRTSKLSDDLFASARTYRVDSTQYGNRILLVDEEGKPVGVSMTVRIRNDTLRLSPSCFEGCHYGFVRLRN